MLEIEQALERCARLERHGLSEALAQAVETAICERFGSGQAPVRSGELRDSIKVIADQGQLMIRSGLPYAQRHPELLPPREELERILDRAAEDFLVAELG